MSLSQQEVDRLVDEAARLLGDALHNAEVVIPSVAIVGGSLREFDKDLVHVLIHPSEPLYADVTSICSLLGGWAHRLVHRTNTEAKVPDGSIALIVVVGGRQRVVMLPWATPATTSSGAVV